MAISALISVYQNHLIVGFFLGDATAIKGGIHEAF